MVKKFIVRSRLILLLMVFMLIMSVPVLGADLLQIGISQFVEHPALDAAREGFKAGLAEAGFLENENVEFIVESAQADFATAQTIAQKFRQKNLDLILAIATPSAQTVANLIKTTPVLITAVTDPVEAGIVDNMEKPGKNITGTTDMNPVKRQLQLIKQFIPDVKTVGILYNAGEVNSVVQVDIAKEAATELGIELKEATVTNTSEVALATSTLVNKVDAIYVPTDNIIVSAMPSVLKVANQNNIPVFGSENSQVEKGAIATLGLDYFLLGKQTGKMAAEVLNGSSPAEMSIQGSSDLKLYINQTAANNLSLEIPADLLEKADKIY